MAQPAKPWVDLRLAEAMRRMAWKPGTYQTRAPDWDAVTKSYPATINGQCRHKCEWLRRTIGGTVIYGHRTDKADAELHAVLWITIGGHDFVLDADGLWPAKSFPFRRVIHPEPPPPPRTWPWPWYAHP